jgi:hypothetical protein
MQPAKIPILSYACSRNQRGNGSARKHLNAAYNLRGPDRDCRAGLVTPSPRLVTQTATARTLNQGYVPEGPPASLDICLVIRSRKLEFPAVFGTAEAPLPGPGPPDAGPGRPRPRPAYWQAVAAGCQSPKLRVCHRDGDDCCPTRWPVRV